MSYSAPPFIPLGRAKTGTTVYYTLPGAVAVSGIAAGGVVGADTDHYTPFVVPTPITVDQIAAEVTTAATDKNIRIGVYAADRDWQPTGAPLFDSGSLSTTSTGVKTYTPASPVTLAPGRYLTVMNNDDATATLALRNWTVYPLGGFTVGTTMGVNYTIRMYATRTYAAFPTPGTAWTTVGSSGTPGFQAPVLLRITTP